ncbi:DUF6544 family protein [Polaromonas sp.]|uniref:DUF6544 family protein n=1 Tax=Polaromonas sp. TaxID=1869339 RepID=UPI0017C39CF6|nr:DUF6544 family protein [Polaromonas sp.]NML85944.1 hypothetical protein [Polaromonas sp.]
MALFSRLACLALGIGFFVAAATVLATLGAHRWAAATDAPLARLQTSRMPATAASSDASELGGLPASVQRYFHPVLNDGQRIISAATVEHTGTFQLSLNDEQ